MNSALLEFEQVLNRLRNNCSILALSPRNSRTFAETAPKRAVARSVLLVPLGAQHEHAVEIPLIRHHRFRRVCVCKHRSRDDDG